MSKKGFKGFNKDLKCRNFQFSENAEFSQDGDPVPCKSGFHYCENPLDVFKYYPPNGDNVYATVEARGVVVQEDHKSVTNKIYVGKRISLSKMFKLCFKVIASLCETSVDANTSACASHANTSGDRSHAIAKGKSSIACALGNKSKVMCSKSGLIVLLKYNDKGQPIGGVVAKVGDVIDGVEIKPNVFYYFDGEKLTCDKR